MSTASIKGHPIHPMLVGLPIGLLTFSFVSDVVYRATGHVTWSTVALYTLGGGIVGALLAAVPGLVDLVTMRDPAAKRLGLMHMTANLAAVAVFAMSFWQHSQGDQSGLPLALSFVAIVLMGIGGWLGGEMVYVRGVAVAPATRLEVTDVPRYVMRESTKRQAS
jgi:uncharacterized membrane protein